MTPLRTINAILLIVFALAVEEWLRSFNIAVGTMLAALIISALFLDIYELILLSLVGVFLLNWQPAPSPELALFLALPLLVHWIKNKTTWQPWLMGTASVVCAIIVFYVVAAPRFFFANAPIMILDIFGSLLFGVIAFALMAPHHE